METVLVTNPTEREVQAAARNQKIPTLREDAILTVS